MPKSGGESHAPGALSRPHQLFPVQGSPRTDILFPAQRLEPILYPRELTRMDGSATQRGDSDSSRSANMPALPINDVPSPAGSTPTANPAHQDQNKPLQPGQASVSRSSSFSRAASFKFTPRDSPAASEVASPPLATSPGGVGAAIASPYPSAAASVATLPASPDFGPISPGGQAIPKALHRSTSTSGPRPSSSRAGSTAVSPLTSPRDEPRGTWSVCLLSFACAYCATLTV